MSTAGAAARDELIAYRTGDAVVLGALQYAFAAVSTFDAAQSLKEVQLCVLNPASASAGLMKSRYFTPACQALRDERLIVINEQFLLRLETAIRSFAQSETLLGVPFVKSDAQMFGLVRRIEADPARSLARLRRQAQRETADAAAERLLQEELGMVALFFIGHELGHLINGHAAGQFATFLDPNAPLEDRVEDAVVKLCRHVDEFAPTQFTLPGFQRAIDAQSDVRRAAAELRAADENRFNRHEAFFANEAEADKWANEVVMAHLSQLEQAAPLEAHRKLYLFARGVFVAALFTWYQDLDRFARKLGIENIANTADLDFQMMRGTERYIHAASLFGEHHRFTLLRAALALEAVIRARSSWFELDPAQRSIWCQDATAAAGSAQARNAYWLAEALQRYFLLCCCMDTAVKLANVGCSAKWMMDTARKRGTPQLFMMQFLPIEHSIERLERMR